MDLQAAVSQAGYFLERSAGIWFSSWAIRRRWGRNYRLSNVAEAVRWTVVLVAYLLAAALPLPVARLISGFVGLAFLCWPNFAYHLTNLFAEWSIAEDCVVSIADAGSRVKLSYSYKHGMDSFGGVATVKRSELPASYSRGQPIAVSYDPLNPNKSKVNLPAVTWTGA